MFTFQPRADRSQSDNHRDLVFEVARYIAAAGDPEDHGRLVEHFREDITKLAPRPIGFR
jgi:hypothetical protein